MDNKYVGNQLQICGAEMMRICGGKGDGMRILNVRNTRGLEFSVSADRCADISRLSLKGDNFGYFSACGYVSPQYYDNRGLGFLKSFTGGFFTTCGLTAVGSPCTDDGEELPLHGTISNTPCDNFSYDTVDGSIRIKAQVREAAQFSHKLLLEREYICPLEENVIYLSDKITNIGSDISPLEILYHCNMGYPLLNEDSVISIPAEKTEARNKHAADHIDKWMVIEKPQSGFEEMCYYHTLKGEPEVSIYNKRIKKGMKMTYNTCELKYFTEWKMMGEYDYVLGLEPGNCLPDGRDVMRKKGILEFLKPNESKSIHIKFEFFEG